MIRRLQIKFVVINMTMVTVMLCVIFGLVYHFTQINLERESVSMMKSVAATPLHLRQPGEEELLGFRLPYFTVQLSPQGEILATGGGYYDLSDEALLEELVKISLNSTQSSGVVPMQDLRFYRQETPRGIVLVFSDMSSEKTTLENLLKSSLVISVFAFFVFLLLSILLSRWAVQPVADAWKQQKQFVADASHELKTPLTVILTNAELLQNTQYSDAERADFSRSILVMSQQMKLLVEELLDLARAEAEQSTPQMVRLDLSKLVMDAAISFEGVFVERGLTLESNAEPGIFVRGNAQNLRQTVDILLDNAQKYSAPGGETKVSLVHFGKNGCRLVVSDPGDPIPEEQLGAIFQRFYRLDAARQRSGSFGLGLSIAARIVEQHRGKIWAESRNGINSFFVELRTEK